MDTQGTDFGRGLIWLLADMHGPPIPPFVLEMVLTDHSHYYVHSVPMRDMETKSLIVRIWDLRAMSADDIDDLKVRLSKMADREELSEEWKVHPKLDWGNLRLDMDQIQYCIEWHDRLWPEALELPFGFKGVSK